MKEVGQHSGNINGKKDRGGDIRIFFSSSFWLFAFSIFPLKMNNKLKQANRTRKKKEIGVVFSTIS